MTPTAYLPHGWRPGVHDQVSNATPDIDVLFVMPAAPDDAWYEQVSRLDDQVQAWTGNRMEYLVFSGSELSRVVERQEPIVDSWLADCVTVHGPSIESVIQNVSAGAALVIA